MASIVLGDFNAQPFEMEMISPGNLNATLFKDVVIRMRSRRVSGRDYPFMYNPTLEFLSEANDNCGSYYSAAGPATFYWYCLDQAVFSPLLADKVAEYRYLRQIGDAALIKDVAPNGEISDHLPLFVRIDWSMGNER
ncbi:hypothetical protein [Paratractidigestivibacter sp.]|uniref:hypothetical protein n=1 Tax=Paratractidigestivibacter sp. TaxID=2847316 RepID=UPI002ABE4A3B|nr:hypothetical protein [Paratractidigestivibacter sp.]